MQKRVTAPLAVPLTLIAGLVGWSLSGAAPAKAQQKFSGQTSVTVVEIPVQVSKDGQPVRGLTRDDFEVLDGREVLPLVDFEVIDLKAKRPDGAQAPIPVSARRHFMFLFDLAFSDPFAIVRARESALDIVRTTLHPSDLAAVAIYSPTRGPSILLGFTSDLRQVEVAINTLGAPKLLDSKADPLGLVVANLGQDVAIQTAALSQQPQGGPRGAEGSQRLDNQQQLLDYLQELGAVSQRIERQLESNKILSLTNSLTDLAGLMGSVDGRKHVVFLSEGFSNSILTGGSGDISSQDEVSRTADIGVSGFQRPSSDVQFGSSKTQNRMEDMLEAFRRASCSIHAVDIGGARAGGDVNDSSRADAGARGNKDSLVAMARSTGGSFFENFNTLTTAFDQLLDQTSVTYLLAVQPTDVKADGKFHKLKVRLKNAARGTELTHRPGYFAPDPKAVINPLATRFESAEKILSGEPGGPVVTSALATPFRVPGQPAYVPVFIEIDGKSLLQGHTGNVLPTEIYAYAIREDGLVADFFTQVLGLDLAKVRPALEASGIKFFGHLDLLPGRYDVRVLVQNGTTKRHSLEVVTVEVPPASTNAPAVMPPLFPEAPGRWLMLREGEAQQKERTVPYPFMVGEQPFLPALLPRLAADSSTDLYLMGYNLAGELVVEAEVRDASTGQKVTGGDLVVTGRGAGTGGADQLTARFDAKGLAAGSYMLQVTVTDRATGLTQGSAAPFEVVAAR